ncbi:MAG: glycosyltransferase [Clostridia bacterium]|nr:glycosyltransferase [Clostridia bacterium]
MIQPKVSVVVPVYKSEKYLERCVNSLLSQTLAEIEIILVDDGSPDGSPEICDAFAAKDGRIKVIHKENAGAGEARNSGITLASGEYIGFVDSDDYVDERMFYALYSAAKKHEAELVLSNICIVGGSIFDAESDAKFEKKSFITETFFDTQDKLNELALGIACSAPGDPEDSKYDMSACKNIYKREVLIRNNVRFLSEREILTEDALFTIDFILNSEKAVGIPFAFYYYCRNEDSISKTYNPKFFEKCFVFLNELEKRYSVRMEKSEYKIYLDRLAQAFGRVFISQEVLHAKEEKIGYRELKGKLREICENPVIRDALCTYPLHKLPKKQAAFAFAMRYRLYFLQKIMVCLRDR